MPFAVDNSDAAAIVVNVRIIVLVAHITSIWELYECRFMRQLVEIFQVGQ